MMLCVKEVIVSYAYEMDFEVKKSKEGSVTGLELVAQPQTEAEVFCGTFPKALKEGKADIRLVDGAIVFDHPTCDYPGMYTATLPEGTTAEDVERFLNGKSFGMRRAGMLTPGFELYAT